MYSDVKMVVQGDESRMESDSTRSCVRSAQHILEFLDLAEGAIIAVASRGKSPL